MDPRKGKLAFWTMDNQLTVLTFGKLLLILLPYLSWRGGSQLLSDCQCWGPLPTSMSDVWENYSLCMFGASDRTQGLCMLGRHATSELHSHPLGEFFKS